MKFQITKHEFQSRMGYLLLGIFASNIAAELRIKLNGALGTGVNFWVINFILILAVLYIFDF